MKAPKALMAALLALCVSDAAPAQSRSSDPAASFFQQQGLVINPPPQSNVASMPQWRVPESPRAVKQEKFDTLVVNGITYTNVLLRTINAVEGALHHDGGLIKIRLGDLPEPVRMRFCEPASLRLIGGHAVSTNGWPRLSGEVTRLLTNGVLARLARAGNDGPLAFVACDPVSENLYEGQPMDVLAQPAGTSRIENKNMPAYDAGLRYRADREISK